MTERKPVVKFVDAICGSGKSHALKEEILSGDKVFKRYLLVMPTLELCNQFSESLQKLKIHSTSISSKDGSATTSLKQALASDWHPRHVICTHEAFKHYCYQAFHDKEMRELLAGFDVYVDEIPSAWFGAYIKIDNTQVMEENYPFLDWLEERDGLFFIKEEYRQNVFDYWKERNANSRELKQLLWVLLSGGGMMIDEDNYLFGFTANPITYASKWAADFTVLGAGISRSEFLYIAESVLEAKIERASEHLHPDLTRRLYPNNNVTICSVMEGDASLERLSYCFTNHMHEIRRKIGKDYIYASNENKHTSFLQCDFLDIADQELGEHGGQRISMASYGLNDFQHFNSAVFLGCSNDNRDVTGKWSKYCERNGWNWSTIKEKRKAARNYEMTYQFVSRCSIRNYDSKKPQLYIVPDRATAEYLKEHYFLDATIECMGFDKPQAERKKSKGDETRAQVQALKAQCFKQKKVAEITGLGIAIIKRYWNK